MTRIALAGTGPSRVELQEVYNRFETRAVWLMEGWANVRGTTPDDLAQVALMSYLSLLGTHDPDDARRLASRGLQQDVRDLYQKDGNNPTGYFAEMLPPDPDDPDEEPGEHGLAAIESSWIYFTPDFVDRLSEHLTGPEVDLLSRVFEADQAQPNIATDLGVTARAVNKRVQAVLSKLRSKDFRG